MNGLDETHDPARRSVVESANSGRSDFPIQNLPYGIFSSGDGRRRAGVAIGDRILDLTALEASGQLRPGGARDVFGTGVLNPLMALGPDAWRDTRRAVARLLDLRSGVRDLPLVPQAGVRMHMPVAVRGFTDFYASREHAENVGTIFRGRENALPQNWLSIPIGYNGRASTVVVSGTPIRRPMGQLKAPEEDLPRFGPSERLDFELEIGALVGQPTEMGSRLSPEEAWETIFGFVLLNDWSARDIQAWEYQPLGPFQGKAFATTISPWVVTRDALAPFRCPAPERARPLLPYLEEKEPHILDIALEVGLAPEGGKETRIARTNARHLYYSAAQQLAHHTSSGCAMETGDLLGSGTISGPEAESRGSMLELSWNGERPVDIEGGERTFLEDGDRVVFTGRCAVEDAAEIGFGRCEGQVLPATGMDARGAV